MNRPIVNSVVFLTIAGLLAACAFHRPRRTPADGSPSAPVKTSLQQLAQGGQEGTQHRAVVERSCIEDHGRFRVGVVEFDDQGQLWSRGQYRQVIDDVKQMYQRAPGGAQLVVFVHGWKHSAKVCDPNLACFRELLGWFAGAGGESGRPVYGVYLGWRGESLKGWGLKELSFWGRKVTAHRVGSADVVEVLTTLETLHRSKHAEVPGTRLTTVGHSFGAAVVYNAVASSLKERLASLIARNLPSPPLLRGFGTLTILVNPAFEASLYQGFDAMLGQPVAFHPRNPRVLVTVGSEADGATRYYFPIGRAISTLFQRTRGWSARKGVLTTLGNYKPFVTHALLTTPDTPASEVQEVSCGCPSKLEAFLTALNTSRTFVVGERADTEEFYGRTKLVRVRSAPQSDSPFIVVRADRRIIGGHSDIWSRPFVEFMASLISRTDALMLQAQGPQ